MATALWGKVYYRDTYAGELRQEPGGRCVFVYDQTYLESREPAIAFTLPRQAEPIICEQGLHPFFDNLTAEGWLRNAQARALKIDPANRFAILLAFGHDCAGAVSVVDPNPVLQADVDVGDPNAAAALVSRASLSGVQPKLLAVKEGGRYRPARSNETSHFIAKLASGSLLDIVENEFVTTAANRALLTGDEVVSLEIAQVDGVDGRALLVERFDRLSTGTKVHFEEFNQLLGRRAGGDGGDKYEAAYDDMGSFIRNTPGCTPIEALRLYRRILACILTGNTDGHLKNFAMFHRREGLRLTPAYDLVAAALYPQYRTLALALGKAANLTIDAVKPKHLLSLGEAFGLDAAGTLKVVNDLGDRRGAVEKAVTAAAKQADATQLGQKLLELMERRWNGSFASTGQYLSRKQSDGGAS